jgi:hypothetical protein
MVLHRGTADLWREGMQKGATLAPPSSPPLFGFSAQPGRDIKQRIKVGPGQYSIVIENSNVVGAVAPPWNPLSVVGANSAVVSYLAELGDDDEDFDD